MRRPLVLGAVLALASWPSLAQGPAPVGFTAAQADHGEDVYVASCALCHGAHMDDAEFAPPLKAAAFRRKWGGKPAAALYGFVKAAMPPGQAGTLPPEDYAAVLAFVLQANGAKPGDKPFPADPAALGAAVVPAS